MASVLGLSILLKSLLSLPTVFTDSHRLNYCFTTMWSPKRSTLPHTEVTVALDDVPILKYSSTNHELQLLFNWLENVDPGHWKALEKTAKYYVLRHQYTVQRLHPSQNYTDSYVFQVKFGCYIYEDNSTSGEEEFGVNGRDFIFLDNEKRRFMASVEEGKLLAKEWNRRPNSAQRQFHYKDLACVQWMRNYLNIKTDNFTKTVRPEVKVWGRISDEEITRLHCLVYGFHPKDVIVKWMRNGANYVLSDEMSPILPHPDGTYQITVRVEVPARDGDTYSCYVEHSSLEEPLNVYLEADWISYTEKRRPRKWMMLVFLIAVISLVFCVVTIRISGRKNKAFTEPD